MGSCFGTQTSQERVDLPLAEMAPGPMVPTTTDRNDLESELLKYAWFRGHTSRLEAKALVEERGAEGHGLFILRHSQSGRGDYVLTVNCRGKAKKVIKVGLIQIEKVQVKIRNRKF